MRLPRLPGLPVSRRRHEVSLALPLVSRRRHEALRQVNEHNMAVAGQHEEQLREVRRVRDRARAAARDYAQEAQEARSERDAALNRVVELEQAIREHASRPLDAQGDDTMATLVHAMRDRDRRLHAVLDGHDRQERDTINDRAEGLL